MRITPLILPLFISALAVAAEPKPADAAADALSPKEAALDRLLTERESPDAFSAAMAEARKQGISEQAILEARFIFHVDRNEDGAIAALLPDFLKRSGTFKLEESEIFATREDWQAVIEYVKAITALQAGDKAAFKNHITEAFWLSPKQGTAFAGHIERLRMEETMASVKIDFAETFLPLDEGNPIALSAVLRGKKALLLQFWSPFSAECEALLPDFAKMVDEVAPKDIAVASIVLENSPKALADARGIIGSKPAGQWLIEHDRNPLSPRLRIQNVPVFVLISPEGRVLSNGSAESVELWSALRKINPAISKPTLNSSPDEN